MTEKKSQVKNPVFDPNKSYTWEQDTKFIFNGSEFGFLLNSLRKSLATPEAQNVLAQAQALQIFEKELEEAVIKGIAKEITPEELKAKQLEQTS
jgi:hypothetical protein